MHNVVMLNETTIDASLNQVIAYLRGENPVQAGAKFRVLGFDRLQRPHREYEAARTRVMKRAGQAQRGKRESERSLAGARPINQGCAIEEPSPDQACSL